jgi:hypothetical protein
MRLIISLVTTCLLASSCLKQPEVVDSSAIVKVNERVLTKVDLEANIPVGVTAEDSIIVAEHYIHAWITDQLKYDIAAKNVVDKNYIEQLVNNYRKSLTIYQYEEQLINEKLSKEIDNRSLLDYYDANKDKFKVDLPIVKGLFLKIPANDPQLDKVRSWCNKSLTVSNISNIENYCAKNAILFGYYVDTWVNLNEIVENWFPRETKMEIDSKTKYVEQQDDNYYYFSHITAYLNAGDKAPFEYAGVTIKEILINQRKIEFLKKFEEDLYNKAVNDRQIIFYNE